MESELEQRHYTRTQRLVHWWVAGLVGAQYIGQNAMRSAMERVGAATTPELGDFLITTAHSLAGLTVLGLMVWRIGMRRKNPVPVAGGKLSVKVSLLARAWHLSLYLAIFFMAISGTASYYTEYELAARLHELCKWVLGTLVIGHMLAGLAHWLLFKDQVLHGMLGNGRDADTIGSSDQSSD